MIDGLLYFFSRCKYALKSEVEDVVDLIFITIWLLSGEDIR